jgi:hypothetical protein
MSSTDLINTAWKAAITILVLRYLYFGRSGLMPYSHGRRSPTPSFTHQQELGAYFDSAEEFDMSELVGESSDTDPVPYPDYLTAGPYFTDPLSRSPSPLPSPMHYMEPPSSNIWSTRFSIHDEAFVTLFTALAALHNDLDSVNSRYILMPILILALITRPHSKERALCMSFLAKLSGSTASPTLHPADAEASAIPIPWEKLDAYSEAIEQLRQDRPISAETLMEPSAPEWNWWDMLKHIDMNMSCKCLISPRAVIQTVAVRIKL